MINRTTKKNDNIIAWGMGTEINLASDRSALGKYVFPIPLFLQDHSTPTIRQKYYNDIVNNPPKYIIDMTYLHNAIPPLDKDLRKNWVPEFTIYEDFKEFNDIYSFVDKNYNVSTSPETGWRIYKLRKQ